MVIITRRWLSPVIALAFVGILLMFFAFQSIADGQTTSALESGLVGVATLALAAFIAQRTLLRQPVKRRRRVSELLD